MSKLSEQIKQNNATAFTHSGKFHADDVFSSALLLYLNPEIRLTRGNKVPEDFDGIVFDIGRGRYDHHQKDSSIRENGIPYAAFGLLWEELGAEILGEDLAQKFDESFVEPFQNNVSCSLHSQNIYRYSGTIVCFIILLYVTLYHLALQNCQFTLSAANDHLSHRSLPRLPAPLSPVLSVFLLLLCVLSYDPDHLL